jgi:hypothetical protein
VAYFEEKIFSLLLLLKNVYKYWSVRQRQMAKKERRKKEEEEEEGLSV